MNLRKNLKLRMKLAVAGFASIQEKQLRTKKLTFTSCIETKYLELIVPGPVILLNILQT